jgi:hypothetical protein
MSVVIVNVAWNVPFAIVVTAAEVPEELMLP